MERRVAMLEKNKLNEKFQRELSSLVHLQENNTCGECGSKGPTWASWNIGVFLCIRCASIHRSLGSHISKVKSLNLDQWTADQIANIKKIGNKKARLHYEATLPAHFDRPSNNVGLEKFIRSKYVKKLYLKSCKVEPLEPMLARNAQNAIKIDASKRETNGFKVSKVLLPTLKLLAPQPIKSVNLWNTDKAEEETKDADVSVKFDPFSVRKTTESSKNSKMEEPWADFSNIDISLAPKTILPVKDPDTKSPKLSNAEILALYNQQIPAFLNPNITWNFDCKENPFKHSQYSERRRAIDFAQEVKESVDKTAHEKFAEIRHNPFIPEKEQSQLPQNIFLHSRYKEVMDDDPWIPHNPLNGKITARIQPDIEANKVKQSSYVKF